MGLGSRFLFYSGFLQVLMIFPIIYFFFRYLRFHLLSTVGQKITELD